MLPTIPTPMTTTSTSLRRCTTLFTSADRCGNFGVHVYVAVPVLTYAQRLAYELHAMPVDRLVVVSVRSGKSDHSPGHHVAIAAIHRITEEAFDRHPQQHVEEHCRRHTVEIHCAAFESFEVGVLGVGRQIAEPGTAFFEIVVDGAQRRMKELRRRKGQLVSL